MVMIVEEETALNAETSNHIAYWEGDVGTLPMAARNVAVRLIKQQCIGSDVTGGSAEDFEVYLEHREEVDRLLANLNLQVKTDRYYNIAYAVHGPSQEKVGALNLKPRRGQGMTLDEFALLCLITEKQSVSDKHGDEGMWFFDKDDFRLEFKRLAHPNNNDSPDVEARYETCLRKLKDSGFICESDTEPNQWKISPLVPVVMNIETMRAAASVLAKVNEDECGEGGKDGVSNDLPDATNDVEESL